MTRTYNIIDKASTKGKKTKGGVVTSFTVNVRDYDHFLAQKTFRTNTYTPKRGKGSYKRNSKYKNNYMDF